MQTNNKLREACVACVNRINDTLPQTDSAIVLTGLANHIKETLQNALSTPPRNCEVGTAEEQAARLFALCDNNKCSSCPCRFTKKTDCALIWSQMPYEEGGAK